MGERRTIDGALTRLAGLRDDWLCTVPRKVRESAFGYVQAVLEAGRVPVEGDGDSPLALGLMRSALSAAGVVLPTGSAIEARRAAATFADGGRVLPDVGASGREASRWDAFSVVELQRLAKAIVQPGPYGAGPLFAEIHAALRARGVRL